MKRIESFIRYFIKKINSNEAEFASAFLAFYILLSFIPILVFTSNLIVKVVPNFNDYIYQSVARLPNDVKNIFIPILDNIFNGVSSSLSIISILSAMWLGSRGFQGLIKSLNKILEVDKKSKIPFYNKLFSLLLTIGFIIVIASLLLFSVFNEKIMGVIESFTDNFELLDDLAEIFLGWVTKLTPFIITAILLFFLYGLAPSFSKDNRPSIKSILLGSVIGTLGIFLVTYFYKLTNDVLQRSPSIYGSLGSLLVTLIWLLTVCNIMIYGAAFIKTYDDIVYKNKTIYDLDPETKLFFDKDKK